MVEARQYVPILKALQGEFDALRHLSRESRAHITPLFDVLRIPTDWDKQQPRYSMEAHLKKVAIAIRKCWPERGSVFVDLFDTAPGDRTSDGTHPVASLLEFLRGAEVRAVPCVGIDRDDAYQDAVTECARLDRRGVCIRLLSEDLETSRNLEVTLSQLLDRLGTRISDTDLLFDFRFIESEAIDRTVAVAVRAMQALKSLREYRSFTMAGTGFPSSLKGVKVRSEGRIHRTEWELWKRTVDSALGVPRMPTFGDYGVCGPDQPYEDPRKLKSSAAIRYTLEDEWLIIKGGRVRDAYEQFYGLSKALVSRDDYCGEQFSWGDQRIRACARESVGTGNLTTWRNVGTNHHIVVVLDQLQRMAKRELEKAATKSISEVNVK